jgi:hypothetical protein
MQVEEFGGFVQIDSWLTGPGKPRCLPSIVTGGSS